jgi:hypothetical protein
LQNQEVAGSNFVGLSLKMKLIADGAFILRLKLFKVFSRSSMTNEKPLKAASARLRVLFHKVPDSDPWHDPFLSPFSLLFW